MNEINALMLLQKCTGDDIWSIDACREAGLPEVWIAELRDTFESGFDTDRNSIYVKQHLTNQYHGVLDLHLAYKLAEFLGVDGAEATRFSLGRQAEVQALKEAVEEL